MSESRPVPMQPPAACLQAQHERLEDLQATPTGVLSMSRDEMCDSKEAVLRERLLRKAIELLGGNPRTTREALRDLSGPACR